MIQFWLMPQPEKKYLPPDIDLDALALLALSEAREMPPGPQRSDAMKRAGVVLNAAHKRGLGFPKLGRPAKD
jgi:hypothetical protein